MQRTFRWLNVLVSLVTLASALAVLWNDLFVIGYRECYRDSLWVVAGYAALQGWFAVAFARDDRRVRWIAIAKAVAAYLFIVLLPALWPRWRVWTPARYVYELFAWGGTNIGLFALIFLGRGAFNTVSAFVLTTEWWRPLRQRRPLLGRLVTAGVIGITVMCVWGWSELVREESRTVSREAWEVAQFVYQNLDCETVRANIGRSSEDIRQRGERTYHIRINYSCSLTTVVVHTEDSQVGSTAGPKLFCFHVPNSN